MKQLFISSAILSIVLQGSAFAQSSATVAAPAASAPAAITSTTQAPRASIVHASYTGIFSGPGLDTDAEHQWKRPNNSDMYVSNRLAARASIAKNLDAGVQARLRTTFATDGLNATNETWRLFANINNVASYNIVSVNLTPRLMLPTANVNHNMTMVPSPELIVAFNIVPKDSRFSLSYSPQMQKILYSNKASALNVDNNALDFYLVHNIEGTYQVNGNTQITFAYYPEYASNLTGKITNTSNEIDLGLNFDFLKGWSLNPYIAAEMNGFSMDKAGKSMQANLVLAGSFL